MRKNRVNLLVILIIFANICLAQESEYQIKAIFLEQFTRFIEWPESSAVENTNLPFIIGVIGDNPFGPILEDTYKERKIKNKPVEIRYFSTVDEIKDLHILFISQSCGSFIHEIASLTRRQSILTVSDKEGFSDFSLINFYKAEDQIKFEINEKAVHDSGLTFSYILYNLAKIVNPIRGEK